MDSRLTPLRMRDSVPANRFVQGESPSGEAKGHGSGPVRTQPLPGIPTLMPRSFPPHAWPALEPLPPSLLLHPQAVDAFATAASVVRARHACTGDPVPFWACGHDPPAGTLDNLGRSPHFIASAWHWGQPSARRRRCQAASQPRCKHRDWRWWCHHLWPHGQCFQQPQRGPQHDDHPWPRPCRPRLYPHPSARRGLPVL